MGLYRPTGIEAFDSLRGLQIVADKIDDPSAKLERVAKGVKLLGAGALLGHPYLVTAHEAYAGPLGQTGNMNMVRLTREMTFISKLDGLHYLLDPDVPVDALTLNFAPPESWYTGPENVERFRDYQLQIPVLSLVAAMSAEIGDV